MTEKGNLFAQGVFALEQGWLYCSIIFTSLMVAIIDKRFTALMAWLAAAAAMAAAGIIHSFIIFDQDITTKLGPAWQWVFGYLVALALLAFVRFCLVKRSDLPEEAPGPAFNRSSNS